MNKIKLSSRVRYQKQYGAIYSSDEGFVGQNTVRLKGALDWDLDKKYTPYISSEVYYLIKPLQSKINKARYLIGVKYKFNKHHSLGVYFMHQREINRTNPQRVFISGVSYSITI
jgi:hypothetical protein